MNRAELLQCLDGVEWTDFEVKAAAKGVPQDAFKTIAAFANSGGGWLVCGVSESDEGYSITGIDDIDRFQNELLSAIRTGDKLRRPPTVLPRLFRFDEGWVLGLAEQAGSGLPFISSSWTHSGRPVTFRGAPKTGGYHLTSDTDEEPGR